MRDRETRVWLSLSAAPATLAGQYNHSGKVVLAHIGPGRARAAIQVAGISDHVDIAAARSVPAMRWKPAA
jgi:hypothetical protein